MTPQRYKTWILNLDVVEDNGFLEFLDSLPDDLEITKHKMFYVRWRVNAKQLIGKENWLSVNLMQHKELICLELNQQLRAETLNRLSRQKIYSTTQTEKTIPDTTTTLDND